MSYLKEFQNRIKSNDRASLVKIWEEYCSCDRLEEDELHAIFKLLIASPLADILGNKTEGILPLWEKVEDKKFRHSFLANILDLQTSNPPKLAQLAYENLRDKYGKQKHFTEKIRLVGLRTCQNFRGAIHNFELLTHLVKGAYVFHKGGWGAGEVIEISLICEEVLLEFEHVVGRKTLPFAKAFKGLIPLSIDHFFARRFEDPEQLEADARKNSVQLIRDLLTDLGPKTALEIKEELYDLVIPAEDWGKWWQNTRSKLRKDAKVFPPSHIRLPFVLRENELSHMDRISELLQEKQELNLLLPRLYSLLRDFPQLTKDKDFAKKMAEQLSERLPADSSPSLGMELMLLISECILSKQHNPNIETAIKESKDISTLIRDMSIVSLKRRLLEEIKKHREDKNALFLSLFFEIPNGVLREYLLKELLNEESRQALTERLTTLLQNPNQFPQLFIWYFQKVIVQPDIPFGDQQGRHLFFESLLTLFASLGHQIENRDTVKKIYGIVTAKRYAVVRDILENSSIEYAREFLLLVSKCLAFSAHDLKLLQSITEVVHPSLVSKQEPSQTTTAIWTTAEGYEKIRQRIEHLSTVETVQNAKEIEAARALGDLRENAEFKFALEKRQRMQQELRILSQDLNLARIISKEDILTDQVSIGSKVALKMKNGEKLSYTILGPWDAKPDENILSFQSQIAKAMMGKSQGNSFSFQSKEYSIEKISSYLDS